jgi:hypothetical protein
MKYNADETIIGFFNIILAIHLCFEMFYKLGKYSMPLPIPFIKTHGRIRLNT